MPRETGLDLPDFYAITAPLEVDGAGKLLEKPLLGQQACRQWLARFERLLESGIELIQLRAKALSPDHLIELATHCQELAENFTRDAPPRHSRAKARSYMDSESPQSACRSDVYVATRPVRLMLNGPPQLATQLGLAGVHLSSSALMALVERPLTNEFLVGASCHSPKELTHAAAIGCDFATLSPVKITKEYGEEETLGLQRFKEWVSECEIPVYGLGGLGKEDLGAIKSAGGKGVAGISTFWCSFPDRGT